MWSLGHRWSNMTTARSTTRRIGCGPTCADQRRAGGGRHRDRTRGPRDAAPVRPYTATLRRHFTHGRLRERRAIVRRVLADDGTRHRPWFRISGEPTVSLDYQAMLINLAYARMVHRPEGDPYIIPRLENYRRGIKRLMAAMLFSYRPKGKVPQGTRQLLPRGVPLEALVGAIMEHHRPIREFLCFEFGHRLMFERVWRSWLRRYCSSRTGELLRCHCTALSVCLGRRRSRETR